MIRKFLKTRTKNNSDEIPDCRGNMLPSISRIAGKSVTMADISKSYARVFSTSEGRRVLDHLQLTTLYRAQSPDIPDSQIRHLEGQRFIIFQILRQIERGRAGF